MKAVWFELVTGVAIHSAVSAGTALPAAAGPPTHLPPPPAR